MLLSRVLEAVLAVHVSTVLENVGRQHGRVWSSVVPMMMLMWLQLVPTVISMIHSW